MKMKKWKLVLGSLLGSAVLGLSAGQAEAAEVGSNLILDTEKHYIIWDPYDQNGQALSKDARVVYDDGGSNEGWLKYDGGRASGGYSKKYTWRIQPVENQTEQFYLRSNSTGFAVKAEGKVITGDTNPGNYVVSDKNTAATGGAYVFEVKQVEDDKTYVAIKSVSTGKYMIPENGTGNRTYVKFSDSTDSSDKNDFWWCIEEDLMPGQEGKEVLWPTTWGEFHYRIPAITTNNQGDLVAAADKRYGSLYDIGTNWPGHPYGHRIDLIRKISDNNGASWGETKNLTVHMTRDPQSDEVKALGFGDPVLVADRESDDVLLFSVSGSYGYVDGKGSPEASIMKSTDGGVNFGEPVKIHQQVYDQIPGLQAFFFSSGRSMQSRYIKEGSHYRIYSAVLGRTGGTGTNSNYVFFSDDFGTTWELLGGQGVAALPAAGGAPDEAKIEELPNGSVLITSRKGAGRYVSVYHYDESDPDRKAGRWDTKTEISYGAGNSTNGEVYIVYAKNKETNEYGYLALQSLPTLDNGTRKGVSIFYKELGEQDVDAAGYASGWDLNNKYLIQKDKSAYSTMTLQADGKIGFMWEERDSEWDILYRGIAISEITSDKYEFAFDAGIGSVATPYEVTTAEQAKAVLQVYNREQVYWDFSDEAKAGLIEALEELCAQAEEVLSGTDALDEDRAEAQALQAALEAAQAADENTEEKEIIRLYGALQTAMETYEGLAELEAGLGAKIDAAQALLEEGRLTAARVEAVKLSDAITAAQNKESSVTYEQIQALSANLDTAMEAYRQADPEDLYVEARYNTNRIQFGAMSGVTQYTIKRSETKDGTYTTVGTVNAVDGKTMYDYVDTTAGKGTQYWYDVEMTGGENIPDLEAEQDTFVTGIAAVQMHAAQDQVHYDFLSGELAGSPEGNPAYFDGNRIFEGSTEDLNKVKDLTKGSVIISFKPDSAEGRKGLLIVKRSNENMPSNGNLNNNVGFAFFQEGTKFRWDSSLGGLRGQWDDTAATGSWNTFGFSNAVYAQGSGINNIINSWNGTLKDGWDSESWNGFMTRATNLGVLTVGGDKTASGMALGYAGKIAYVTITDETMSQDEINAYTGELNELLIAFETQTTAPEAPTGFTAVAGDGEAVLRWTAVEGVITRYEISVDDGANWRDVSNVTSYTWTGLESGTYTFLLRAVNANGEGEAATVSVTLEESTVEVVEAPVFSPAGGTYSSAQSVEITTETSDAVIYYTTDGSTPDSSAAEYTGAVTVSESMTLKAIAVKEGMDDSRVVTAEYTIEIPAVPVETVKAPVFTPAGGTYTEAQTVEITTETEDAVIYYTTDGSDPDSSSVEYTGAVTVSESMTLKAIAVKEGMDDSRVSTAEYVINISAPAETRVAAPEFSLAGGVISGIQNVSIDCATEGAEIYYTINGSTPSEENEQYRAKSLKYDSPLAVNQTMVIKAVAVKDGLESSEVVTVKYETKKPWIFKDVNEDGGWIHKALTYTYNAGGIMAENGNGSGKFDPGKDVTREMFATVVYRMAGSPGAASKAPFSDMVAGKYYETPVSWAYENKIVKGKGNNLYGVGKEVTRAEIAQMLYNYAEFAGFDISISNDLSSFSDYKIVSSSSWMEKPLSWANAAGMINGKPQEDGSARLAPNDYATRAECAAMIQRFADKFIK